LGFNNGGKNMGHLCDYGNMGMSGGMGWGMGFGWLLFVVFWALVIAALVLVVKKLMAPTQAAGGAPQQTPLEILQSRYARGEIEREEYEQKKRDLLSST
jgi:putative membrane protein